MGTHLKITKKEFRKYITSKLFSSQESRLDLMDDLSVLSVSNTVISDSELMLALETAGDYALHSTEISRLFVDFGVLDSEEKAYRLISIAHGNWWSLRAILAAANTVRAVQSYKCSMCDRKETRISAIDTLGYSVLDWIPVSWQSRIKNWESELYQGHYLIVPYPKVVMVYGKVCGKNVQDYFCREHIPFDLSIRELFMQREAQYREGR